MIFSGEEGPGGAKKKDKEYELGSNDEFWGKHKGSPFPQVRNTLFLQCLKYLELCTDYIKIKNSHFLQRIINSFIKMDIKCTIIGSKPVFLAHL